jgi:alcohol dehydrogenase (cytochrome c)
VRAIDVRTGKPVWGFKLPSPPWAGVMASAGGLVFGGSNEGNFFALDAATGRPLWQFQTGGAIRSGDVVSRERQTARRDRNGRAMEDWLF